MMMMPILSALPLAFMGHPSASILPSVRSGSREKRPGTTLNCRGGGGEGSTSVWGSFQLDIENSIEYSVDISIEFYRVAHSTAKLNRTFNKVSNIQLN